MIGDFAGCCTLGDGNTFVGQGSGNCITTGTGNTIIGVGAGPGVNLSNSISIGNNACPTVSGQLAFGSVVTALTAGAIAGYICTNINGSNYKIPYYNV
jgi:hypothetical protein